ncbi:TonB-linked outer membrane protein, SusC/RagA family [Fodinibius roseus]|uniref:TonB-linked outer membrane protein, SusC/RagA family n=1 Tax=Fodinibius roseus TaxID=1194090 RepID=A0A1M5KS73_9BACT|nr:TonB-dependent receptor [Fodinibius roseus]SHG55712.1 TonB-linked outer membrane protein, SusC/RagA family [Fodinibius roseus]
MEKNIRWITVGLGIMFLSLFGLPANLYAQQQNVNGTVTDASTSETMPGVNVLVKGTTMGTSTDAEGRYELVVSSLSDTLVFSFVGYQIKEVPIDGRTEIDVSIEQAVTELEKVVAVGYASRQAGEVTGSVSMVSAEQIEEASAVNISEVLRITTSGITATESHTPGEGATIQIRGLTTINDNNPLWVVDGVPGAPQPPPEQVESISVLKDASSQAIYGARAANGVILVTTKSGRKNQKMQVNVSTKYGFTRNVEEYNLLNTREYGEMLWLEANNDGIENFSHALYGSGDEPDIPEYILPARGGSVDHSLYDNQMSHVDGDDTFLITKANQEGTNWYDVLLRDASFQNYNIDMSGGSENAVYAVQAGYTEEQGMVKHTGFERYTIRSNTTFDPLKWLEIGERVGIEYSVDEGRQATGGRHGAFSSISTLAPIIPVYTIMGDFAGTRVPSTGNGYNPLSLAYHNRYDERNSLSISNNIHAKATIFKNLEFQSRFGYEFTKQENEDYSYSMVERSERDRYTQFSLTNNNRQNMTWSNTLEYSDTFAGLHDVNVVVGTEAVDNLWEWNSGQGEKFFSKDPNYIQLDAAEQNKNVSGSLSEWSLFSMFGRVNYQYDDKYLVEGVIRRDGSSRFGEENRHGNFPAVSVGWRMTNESFMAFTDNWLNLLKLRVGYGKTGNDRIGNYNSFTSFASSLGGGLGSYYPITGIQDGPGDRGFYRSSYGNPEVRWETTTTYNFGLDATIFENIDLTVDLWKRKTNDMLYPRLFPDVLGRATPPSVNVGTMENNGIDVELGYNGSTLNQELVYNVSLNVSHYKNELVRLTNVEEEFLAGGEAAQTQNTRTETGRQFPEFYGYIVEGIFQSQEEADDHPAAFGSGGTYNEAGHFKYKDVNGDGVINSDDRTYIGDPHPDFTAGLSFNLSYKRFSLSTHLYGIYGNEIGNMARRRLDFQWYTMNRSKRRLYESWGSPYLENNENAKMPKIGQGETGSMRESSYFIEDGSFLRMRNLQLGYDLGSLFDGDAFTLRRFQIYGRVSNVFTITNYSGVDPDVQGTGMDKGIDRGEWPTPRQFILGMNIGF